MSRNEAFQRLPLAQQQQTGQRRHGLAIDGHRQLQGFLQPLIGQFQQITALDW